MRERIRKKIHWLLRHLDRGTVVVTVSRSRQEVVGQISQALTNPSAPGMDKASRKELRKAGFVTGSIRTDADPITFKLTGYRSNEWFGKLTPSLDPDKMAKPALTGKVSGDQFRTDVRYRVDAFGTAVSALVLAVLGVLMLTAGVAVSVLHPMPMPSIGFLLLVFGGVCLIFEFLIWQVLDKAILDEEFLTDWLPRVLGAESL